MVDEIASISQAHAKCFNSFPRLIFASKQPAQDSRDQAPPDDIVEEFDRCKLWAANVGAGHSGGQYEISLDYRLREASFYKTQVQKATLCLQGKRKPCEEPPPRTCKSTADPTKPPQDDSDEETEAEDSPWEISSSSDDEAGPRDRPEHVEEHGTTFTVRLLATEINKSSPIVVQEPIGEAAKLLQSIKFTITCLYRMPIRRPAPLERLNDRREESDKSHYLQFDIRYVKDKFPMLDSEVATRLGKMISRRRQLLSYRSSHHKRLQGKSAPETATPALPIADQALPEAITGSRLASHAAEQALPEAITGSPLASHAGGMTQHTKATTFCNIGEIPPALCLPSPSVAVSVSSRGSSYAEGNLCVEVPPSPKGDNGGTLVTFECPYCFVVKTIKTNRAWRKHVLGDLQPYVCTYPGCDLSEHPFESRGEWHSHESRRHRVEWLCGVIGHPGYAERAEFLAHMKQAHGTTFEDSQLTLLANMFQRASGSRGGICNLCQRPCDNLEIHVSRHLEQIALFSLPRVNGNEEVNSYPSGRDANSLADVSRLQDGPSVSQRSDPASRGELSEPIHTQGPDFPPQPERSLSPKSFELLPVCPKRNLLSGGKWFQMPSIPNFDVCMRCYYTHIHPSPFSQQFVYSEKPRATETSCSFITERILQKIWPSVMRTGNLGLLQDYALTRSNIPECHAISGNTMGALSSRWWKVRDGSIPRFRCCDACYQDIVMATELISYFSLTNPQPEEEAWICDLSFPFVAGGMLSVSKYQEQGPGDQWDDFTSIVKYRLRVKPCPGERPTKSAGREWWTPEKPLPGLIICGACNCDNVVPHFPDTFIRHYPPPQQSISCAMASFAIKAPWDCSVQKNSYELWWEAIHAYITLPPCTDKGFSDQQVRGEWFTLQRHHKNLDNFKCCRTCYRSLIKPLGLERYFDPIYYPVEGPPVTRICELRSSGPRYAAYMGKLKEASDQKDFGRFLDYVTPRAKIPPCLPGKFLQGSNWYGTKDFAICEECWYEHVKDSILDSQLTMRCRFSNEVQACDLYSLRMKREWATACAKRDIGYFAHSAIVRGQVYYYVKERSEEITAEINTRKVISGSGGVTVYKGPGGACSYKYGNGNPRMRGGRNVMNMEISALNRELDELQRTWKAAE